MAKSDDVASGGHFAEPTGSPAGSANAEPALPQSADLFRALFFDHPDCVALIAEGKIVLTNTRFAELTGYSTQEAIGLVPSDLIIPEEQERGKERVRTLLDAGPEHPSAYTLVKSDGTHIPIIAHSRKIEHDGKPALLTVVRDISVQRQAEEAQRSSEGRYRRLLDVAPDGIVVVDQAGVIETVNSRTLELFGYSRAELIGEPMEMLLPERFRERHPAHRDAYAAAPYVRPMSSGLDLYGLRKDGSEFPIDLSLNALQTDDQLSIIATVRDMTRAAEGRKALHDSEHRYRTLYELASDAFLTVLPDGEVVDGNAAAAELLGYTLEELTELTGEDDIIAPEIMEETEAAWREQLLERGQFLVDTQWVRKDGSRVHVSVSGKPLTVGDQQQIQLIGRDITERKVAEEALKASEDRYRTLYDLASDAFVYSKMDGEIIGANAATLDLLGYTVDELVGLSGSRDIIAPEVVEQATRERSEQLETSGRYLVETLFVRKDGSRVPVSVSGKVVEIAGQQFQQIIARDITERKQAEEELTESREHYRTLFLAHPDGVALTIEGKLALYNDRMAEMTGYSVEEAIGMAPSDFIVANERERADERIEAQTAGETRPPAEYSLIRKDGSTLAIDVHSKPIQHNGKPAVLTVVRDITERKQAEEALRESEATNRAILAAMPDLIFQLDSAGTYLSAQTGFESDQIVDDADFIGRSIRDLLPDLADGFMSAIAKTLENETTETVHYTLNLKGVTHYFEARITASAEDQVVMIVRDTTTQREAEEALRALEQERYRRLLEVAPDGIVIVDEAGVIETVNAQTEALFRYDRKELIGKPIEILIPERIRQQHVGNRQAYTASPHPRAMGAEIDLFGVRKDGSLFPIDVSLNSMQTEDGISIIASVRDVTERMLAEKTLRDSEARFSKAFHDNPVPSSIIRSEDNTVMDVNDAMLALIGYRRSEAIGRSSAEIDILADKVVIDEVEEGIRDHGVVRDIPARFQKKDDEVLDLLVSVTQIELDGEPCRLTTVVDMTERNRLRDELQAMRDDLETKVERRMEGDNPYKLTFREFTVLHLIADGKADKEIAVELGISIYTVHRHVSHILAKMDSPSRTEAGTRALREGLLD